MKNIQINKYDEPLNPKVAIFLMACFTVLAAITLCAMSPGFRV